MHFTVKCQGMPDRTYEGIKPLESPKDVEGDAVVVLAWFDGEPDVWVTQPGRLGEVLRYYRDQGWELGKPPMGDDLQQLILGDFFKVQHLEKGPMGGIHASRLGAVLDGKEFHVELEPRGSRPACGVFGCLNGATWAGDGCGPRCAEHA